MPNVLDNEEALDDRGPQISQIRRPLFIAGAFIAAVFMLTIWSLSSKKERPAREDDQVQKAEAPIYVPDRESALKLEAETARADEEANAMQTETDLQGDGLPQEPAEVGANPATRATSFRWGRASPAS